MLSFLDIARLQVKERKRKILFTQQQQQQKTTEKRVYKCIRCLPDFSRTNIVRDPICNQMNIFSILVQNVCLVNKTLRI